MYPYELMQDYRKGTYLKIIFNNNTLKGFFRAWIDCKNKEKALLIDQTYPQHVDFMIQLYHLNNEKAEEFTLAQTLAKDHYQDFSTSKILYSEDIQKVEEIKLITCPVCSEPMQRNESLTTPHNYWFCKCFGHSFKTRRIVEIIEKKKIAQISGFIQFNQNPIKIQKKVKKNHSLEIKWKVPFSRR